MRVLFFGFETGQQAKKIANHVLKGGIASLVFFMMTASFIFLLLFATVHDRPISQSEKYTQERYPLLLKFWNERGYFKHGGLWVLSSADTAHKEAWNPPQPGEPVNYAYRSSAMGLLFFGNLLQQINIAFNGDFSHKLMRIHNQFFVLLSAALLALISLRTSIKVGISPYKAILLALSSQAVFQTFPVNLAYVWEVYPSTISTPFLLAYLLLFEKIFCTETPQKKYIFGAFFSGVIAFYIDPQTVGFFFLFLAVIWSLFGSKESLRKNFLKIAIFPILLGLMIFASQILLIKANYPQIEFVGSNFWFRTGFDGSTQYYTDHSALFTVRKMFFLKWYFLFFGGFVGFLFFIFGYKKYINNNYLSTVIFALLCLYLPVAFVISQAVVIHAYYFDAYLALSAVLLLFSVLPMMLEKISGNWGGAILLFVITAFCYTFVQLRTYTIVYPLSG